MNLVEEARKTLRMEIRSNSRGSEYLEAVIDTKDLDLLTSLLGKHLGRAAKEPGREANLPKEIQRLVDSLGGLRKDQSFFYRQDGSKITFGLIWPWESDPGKATLKSGVCRCTG